MRVLVATGIAAAAMLSGCGGAAGAAAKNNSTKAAAKDIKTVVADDKKTVTKDKNTVADDKKTLIDDVKTAEGEKNVTKDDAKRTADKKKLKDAEDKLVTDKAEEGKEAGVAEKPNCTLAKSLSPDCTDCRDSNQCSSGFCCPWMKKCIANGKQACNTPTGNCDRKSYGATAADLKDCRRNTNSPDGYWGLPTCGSPSLPPAQPPWPVQHAIFLYRFSKFFNKKVPLAAFQPDGILPGNVFVSQHTDTTATSAEDCAKKSVAAQGPSFLYTPATGKCSINKGMRIGTKRGLWREPAVEKYSRAAASTVLTEVRLSHWRSFAAALVAGISGGGLVLITLKVFAGKKEAHSHALLADA